MYSKIYAFEKFLDSCNESAENLLESFDWNFCKLIF